MYEWNKPFQLIMKIKHDYQSKFDDGCMIFDEWIKRLNNDEYNNFIEPLQINQHKNLILIRYGLAEMQRGMWEDENSIYRQCRSLVIDLENEEIVVSPFKKFFNLNEVEENKLERILGEIEVANLVEITDKLDGSMQSCRYYNDEFMMFGSMALDEENSWRLQDGKSMLSDNHKRMIKDLDRCTFVFEYISVKDAHVVSYNKESEGLYLIGIINVDTGKESSYADVKEVADDYGIKMTEIENRTLEEILELSKTLKSNEKEGWVLNIDGHRVKLKCDDYVSIHRILDHVSSPNVVIQAIADDKFDDLISKIPDNNRARIIEISNKIFNYLKESNKYIDEMYARCYNEDKKEFMIAVENLVDKKFRGFIRAKYLGQEVNLLKTQNGSYKKMGDLFDE